MVFLVAVAGVETAAIVVLVVLLLRSRTEARELRDRLAAKRWVPSTRSAVKAVGAVGRTAALVRDRGISGALRSSIEELAGWAQVERPDLGGLADRDGTVTIAFSDIEGSTALNEQLGDKAWLKVLRRHDAAIRRAVQAHSGCVVKAQGDGFMLAFGAPADAVGCAVRIQRTLAGATRPPIRIRIGIHRGPAVHRDGDLFGRNVAYAARVAAAADGGEILASHAVVEVLEAQDANPGAVSWEEGRDVELRGLPGWHRLYAAHWA